MINLDEYADVGTHWIIFSVLNNNAIYFDSFGVEQIPKDIRCFTGTKNMQTNIFRIQAYDSIMCGYFCIGFLLHACRQNFDSLYQSVFAA